MKTPSAKKGQVERNWVLVDAEGQTLGRLATQIANILRGKNKVNYTPHVDTGDFVVVINAEKIQLTGRKWDQKKYYSYSGWQSGLRETVARKMLETKPEFIIWKAVRNMIPNPGLRSGKNYMRKLKVYAGPEHPHQAQQPQQISL